MKRIILVLLVCLVISLTITYLIHENEADKILIDENNMSDVNAENNNENIQSEGFKIKTVLDEHVIKGKGDEILINVKAEYPVIENKESKGFIENINNVYKVIYDTFLQECNDSKDDAQYLYEQMNEEFRPYARELSYEININKKGLLSITTIKYINSGGAHGNMIKESKNFDINKEEELKLNEIINNEVWDIEKNIYSMFKEKLEKDGLKLDEMWDNVLKDEINNVQYYIKEGAIVLYFNTDQVAPYAVGIPTIEIPYDDDIFLIKI